MIDFKLFSSKVKRIALRFALLPAMAMASFGAIVYDTTAVAELTGSRTNLTGGGVDTVQFNSTATDHFTISWAITNPVAGTWHYSYTLAGTPNGSGGVGLSHFILDTSDNCINVAAGTLADPNCITNITISSVTVALIPGDYNASTSNPNFPAGADIIGVKFNVTGGPPLPVTFTFDSNRPPVYGDFYLQVANSTTAVNNGLGAGGPATVLSDFFARTHSGTPETPTDLL